MCYCARAAGKDKQQQASQSISVRSCTQVPEGAYASQAIDDVEAQIKGKMDDLNAEKSGKATHEALSVKRSADP